MLTYKNGHKKTIKTLFFLSFFLFSLLLKAYAYVEGPFVNNITEKSAIIWWKCFPPISGKVYVGEKVFEKKIPPFEVKIKGLRPDTTYKYYLKLKNGIRLPKKGYYKFHTAFLGDKSFRFAVLADSRGLFSFIPINKRILKLLLSDIKKRKVAFVCFLGDLAYGNENKKEEELRDKLRLWKEVASFIMHEIPIYTAIGNHDIVMHKVKTKCGDFMVDGAKKDGTIIYGEEIFADEFVNPENSPSPEGPSSPPYKETAYSFNWGNSHFVFINTEYWAVYPEGKKCEIYKSGNLPGKIMKNQLRWIEEDIRRAKISGAKHIFVFGHRPVFPITEQESSTTEEAKRQIEESRKRLWAIFEKYSVDAAFFGHEHNYSRTIIGNTWQIITGGAGAPLHSIKKIRYPWKTKVRALYKGYHYCIITVKGDKVLLDVYGIKKGKIQLIDHAQL